VLRAEASVRRETVCVRLERTLRLAADPWERGVIVLEVAERYAALFGRDVDVHFLTSRVTLTRTRDRDCPYCL
jgi:hypothetical protein